MSCWRSATSWLRHQSIRKTCWIVFENLFYLSCIHGRKHINSTRLRTARLSSMQKLLDQQQTNAKPLPLIPDGFAKDTDESTVMHESTPAVSSGHLNKPRSCYVCKKRYIELHHFYDQLCPSCALLNFSKRQQVFLCMIIHNSMFVELSRHSIESLRDAVQA